MDQQKVNSDMYNLSNTKDELIQIVDEEDNPIEVATRLRARQEKLRHRASYIFVVNSQDQWFIQKRSMGKEYCPGYFDLCSGGMMGPGEDHLESAYRELDEEMGINECKLEYVCKDITEDVVCYIYFGKYDGETKCNDGEVESVHLWTREEMKEKEQTEKITPDSVRLFDKYEEVLLNLKNSS